jgi:hypothetical protein
MKQAVLAMAFLGLLSHFAPARAAAPPTKEPPGAAKQPEKMQTFLGVGVESVPQALSSQMPGIVPKGQGVLVGRVAKDSPAAKAGLHPYDILLSYGDQKLSSPEQLVKLVREDRPGHEVALHFVRAGKPQSCKVTLGKHEAAHVSAQPRVFRLRPEQRFRQLFPRPGSKDEDQAWESFDALKLTRLGNNRWRVEIEYRSKQGKTEHKTFEGTREQLRKDIQAEKDLPANERSHLLRALNLHEPVFEFHFPPFDKMGPTFWEEP